MRGEATELYSHNSQNPQNLTDAQNIANIENIAKGVEPELIERVSEACSGLEITPAQFTALCTEEDLEYIRNGVFSIKALRTYASNFADGIRTKRIIFHPKSQELIRHITACQWSAEQENNTR